MEALLHNKTPLSASSRQPVHQKAHSLLLSDLWRGWHGCWEKEEEEEEKKEEDGVGDEASL